MSVYCIGNTLENRSMLGQIHPGFATRGFDPSVRLETSTEQKPPNRRGRLPAPKGWGRCSPSSERLDLGAKLVSDAPEQA